MNKYLVRVNENGSLVDYDVEAESLNAFSEGVFFYRQNTFNLDDEIRWPVDEVVAYFRNPISITKQDPDTRIYDLSTEEDCERLLAKISQE